MHAADRFAGLIEIQMQIASRRRISFVNSKRQRRRFQGQTGQVAIDQLRAVDQSRLVKKLGRITPSTQAQILATLQEMFAH